MAILATAAVLLLEPDPARTFLVAAALVALIGTQLLFWLVVQPVNRQWLGSTKLSGAAERFFRTGEAAGTTEWTRLRDRWERGHLLRTVTAAIALVLLLIALAAHS